MNILLISNQDENKTGVGRYSQEVEEAISLRNVIEKKSPLRFFNYPFFIHKSDADSIHILSQDLGFVLNFMSKTQKRKTIITVHDVIPLQYPLFEQAEHLFFKKFDKWFFKKSIESLKQAEQIICVSYATKKNLLQYINYPENKIQVIYEYPSKEFINLHKNRNPYDIMYVGSEMPHKNLKVLIEALGYVKNKIPHIRLIKIGKSHWPGAREQLLELANKKNLTKNILWKDTVEDLAEDYNCATLLVHPSLHEGFGFPIVEAMACGCPVLCSDKDSLPELGGTAVEYFNPENEKELAEKIIKIVENKRIQEEMRKKGLLQVHNFNQERFKKETVAVYRKCFGSV